MPKLFKIITLRLSVLLVLLVILPGIGAAAEVVLKVGVYENKPTIFMDEDGRAKGLFIDILEEIAEREGWRLEYVDGHFSEILALLKKDKIDILPALAYSEEREKTIDYTSGTVMANWAELYVPAGAKLNSLLELEGKKVAVKQGDIHFTALKQMVKNFNISCRFFETDEYTTVFEMLDAEYVHVGVVNRLYGHRSKGAFAIRETPVIFNPIEMRYGAPKGRKQEILSIIDSYLLRFTQDQGSIYYRSINRWFIVDTGTRIPSWLIYSLAAIAGITLLFIVASVLFRYQVKKRTQQLTEANRLLEAQILERTRAEKKLQDFARIVEASSDAIALMDTQNNHILANRNYLEEIAGGEFAIEERTVRDILGAEFFDNELKSGVERCLDGQTVTLQVNLWPESAERNIWDITLNPYYAGGSSVVGYVMDMRNVTQQVELQNRYKDAQKMEAIGLLAGGVAHDLNNILSGLVSYPDMLLVGRDSDDPMTKPLETIRRSGERAAAIVQDLLTLARRGSGSMEPVCLNSLVSDFMASPEYKEIVNWTEGVEVEFTPGHDLLLIKGYAPHLEKALMNLVANGVEAIEGEGVLTITTENIFTNYELQAYEVVPPGEYVLLEVSDTGIGMSEEQFDRIFEPFYSSKKMGRSGTGLGMAVVWGVIKDHEAYVDIETMPGKGSTFKIYFPVVRETLKQIDKESQELARGDGQRILVVDDMEEQRELAGRILEMLGYKVVLAASGEEAVDLCRSSDFDILLLDMIMPGGIGGLETYEKIVKFSPGLKAVIASGYSDKIRVKKAQELGAGSYISKPYTVRSLAQAIKQELEAKKVAGSGIPS